MGWNDSDWTSLGQLFNQAGTMFAPPGSAQADFNARMHDTFSAQQMQAALKKQKEEEEKKKKAGLFGSVGSTLGTIAGIALAPATGGASLLPAIAGGAIGSAVGGTAGSMLGGGGFNPQQTLGYGAQGALGGLTAGMFAPAPNASQALAGGAKGAYTGANTAGGFNPFGKFTPAATSPAKSGLFSNLASNPNLQGYFRSQIPGMAAQGLGSMFQQAPDGFHMRGKPDVKNLLFKYPSESFYSGY